MLQIVDSYGSGLLFILQVLFFLRCSLGRSLEISKKKLFLIIIFISCFYAVVFLNFEGVLKSLILFFINVILTIKLYKIPLAKAIFMTFFYMVIILIPDLFVLFGLINIFNMSREFCYNIFAGTFLGSFLIFLIFIMIVFLIKKPLKKLFELQIDTDKKLIFFSILTFVCILMFFYTIVEKFQFTNDIFLYLLCIVILLLVLFNLIKQVIDNRKLSTKYDKLLEFMTTYETEIEQQRILRHEIKNEFLVVRAKLLDSQKNDEIVNYIDEILKDKIIINQEKYAKFGYLPPGIKGLCYFKVQETENMEVKVSINISKKVKEFDINVLTLSQQRNLARILGVFLDNAKEASNLSSGKQMGLEIYYDNNNELKFIISNTFDNEIDINKIGKVAFSTKGNGRGHGLMLVNYILESNKIFKVNTDIKNNVYVQNLSIQVKNDK